MVRILLRKASFVEIRSANASPCAPGFTLIVKEIGLKSQITAQLIRNTRNIRNFGSFVAIDPELKEYTHTHKRRRRGQGAAAPPQAGQEAVSL